MVWSIFHLLPINVKIQWAILSKFNIAISVVNGPFLFVDWVYGPWPHPSYNTGSKKREWDPGSGTLGVGPLEWDPWSGTLGVGPWE